MRVSIDWPLCARDAELAAITAALDRTRSVLLAGSAGVGKTRLARTALVARESGWSVRWLAASASSAAIPLGVFAPVLGASPEDSVGTPDLLGHVYACLRAQRRIVLGIDDAHHLDEVSASLVHKLVVERAVPLIITLRTDEPVPRAVARIAENGLVARIDVRPLTAAQTATVLEAVLGGRVATDTVRQLHEVTGGNLLWLRHLVAGEREAVRLAVKDGLWVWSGRPQLTPALVDLIDMRIGPVAQGVRPVIELVALGEPLPLAALEALTTAERVRAALGRGLVQVADSAVDHEVRLAHPLYGEVIRARIDELRTRRLCGDLATVLAEHRDDGPTTVLRRSVLLLDSDLIPDPNLLTTAAQHATRQGDVDLSLRLLRAACGYGGGVEAHLGLAFALSHNSRFAEAEPVFAAAMQRAGDGAERNRVVHFHAMNLFFGLLRIEEAISMLESAAAAGESPEILSVRAFFDAAGGRWSAVEPVARRVLDLRSVGARAEVLATYALAIMCGVVGRAEQLPTLCARGRAAARRSSDMIQMQGNLSRIEALGLTLAGCPPDIRAGITSMRESSAGPSGRLRLASLEGILELAVGRVDRAVPLLRESRLFTVGHSGGITTIFEALLALACGAAGDAAGAREALQRAEQHRHPGCTFMDPLVELGRAWVAAAEGAVSTAITTAQAAAQFAADSGQWAVEMYSRHAGVCFGDTTQASRLRELSTVVDGPRVRLAAGHAEALTAADPDALIAASHGFQVAELLLPAADAAAQAAQLYIRHRDNAPATRAAARARSLATECGARTPALLSADDPLSLSDRQREIGTLAAGLTNKQIAEKLSVSLRTVEGHIYHACLRLNLPNRAALAAYLTATRGHAERGQLPRDR